MKRLIAALAAAGMLGLAAIYGLSAPNAAPPPQSTVVVTPAVISLPETIDKGCRNGRAKLYDECGDQIALFEAARKRAAEENRILLVSYGAEWCIWCHVFKAYVRGEKDKFTYTYGSPQEVEKRYTATMLERAKSDATADAAALRKLAAESFVVVHIDHQYGPNGRAVLRQAGALAHDTGGLPFIFAVDATGRFAALFDHDRVELRRDTADWYRGYDRVRLMAMLMEMQKAARK